MFCIFTYSNTVNGRYYIFFVILQKCSVANKAFTAAILSLSSFFHKPYILYCYSEEGHSFFLIEFLQLRK